MNEDNKKWIDRRIKTPLNACSLEVFQKGVLPCCKPDLLHPVVIGCYELCESNNNTTINNDSNGGGEEDRIDDGNAKENSTRNGALLLHMIPASTNDNNETPINTPNENYLKFGKCNHELHTSSGILDGKWYQRSSIPLKCFDDNNNYMKEETSLYATACASGAIELYHLQSSKQEEEEYCDDQITTNHNHGLEWKLNYLVSSHVSNDDNDDDHADEYADDNDDHADHGLALSLAWDESIDLKSTLSTRIVSSYSKGSLAVHNINISSTHSYNSNDTNNDDDNHLHHPISIERTHCWDAHTLFGCAAEVWTTCFASNTNYGTYSDIVISGGDDCQMKLWDLRTCSNSGNIKNRPIHCIGEEEFGAGVTAVTYHPFLEHVFCSGSYDEYIRLWDMRKMDSKEPLCSLNVGGGVWRVKWHPTDYNKILVGAMHGGCRVVDVPVLEKTQQGIINTSNEDEEITEVPWEMNIQKEFLEHKSMAYGADWIHLEGSYEAAASCSFYDRQAFIWQTKQ